MVWLLMGSVMPGAHLLRADMSVAFHRWTDIRTHPLPPIQFVYGTTDRPVPSNWEHWRGNLDSAESSGCQCQL